MRLGAYIPRMTRELPIFPLPLVLFPGIPQALHIFEPRYRQLLADCLAADRRFGIARSDASAPDKESPQPGQAGCIALIRSTQALPDGRSNIITVGESRFVLQSWVTSDRPYRVARVAEFEDEPQEAAEAAALATDVRQAFARLMAALATLSDRAPDVADLPTDPAQLSFHVAAAVDLDLDAKQELLASRRVTGRLRHLATLLAALTPAAEERALVHGRARGNGKGGAHPDIERTT